MKFKYVLVVMIVTLAMSSCKKKKDTMQANVSAVTISVLSPVEGHIYSSGDTVYVKASIGYAGMLHGYEIRVTDTATDAVLFDVAEHSHSDSFVVDDYFVVSGTEEIVLLLDVRAEVEHGGEIAERQLYCVFRP